MSGFGPAGSGSNPFEGIFGDLARLLGAASSGPLNWDVARQVAQLMATEGGTEPNVDPLARIKLEELARVAELHVTRVTLLEPHVRTVEAITRAQWATRTLDSYRPLLERLAVSLATAPEPNPEPDPWSGDLPKLPEEMDQLAQIQHWMGPVLFGTQAGGMVGHLAKRSLGQFDLPIPRPGSDTLVLVPANIAAFAQDWSLPPDEVALYVCVEELLRFAILSKPHVQKRLSDLLTQYTSGFRPDPTALQEQLNGLDASVPIDPMALLNNPQALLGAMQTPEQRHVLAQLNAVITTLVGYVDHVTRQIVNSTTTSASAIAEAVKRQRVEESDGQRLVEQLFGLELTQAQFDRGAAFVAGIIERTQDKQNQIERLWNSANELPTPAEIDAPGLWLERIDLPPFNLTL